MTATAQTPPTLAEALVAFQADAPKIALDGLNPHFKSKFPSLAGVMDTVRPALARQGLAVVQMPAVYEGQAALTTRLIHTSGESIQSTMFLLPAKPDPQGQGAAITYARRYAVLGLLGLVGDEDDDGNTASTPPPKAAEPKPKFVAPKANGAKPDKETERLIAELLALADKLGAVEATTESIAKNAAIGDLPGHKAWLKRCIETAKQNLDAKNPVPF